MTVSTADAPKANARPGDEDVAPVDTSPFIMGAFTPRTDEACVEFRLEDAVVLGAFPNDLVGTFLRIGPIQNLISLENRIMCLMATE